MQFKRLACGCFGAQAETGFLLDLPAKWISGWPQETLTGSNSAASKCILSIEPGRFPCGFSSFSLTFGSLHMVTHEFRSGNPGNDRAKISIHRSLARYGSFLSRHSRTFGSRIHHIEMSTSERPVVKCRHWIQLDPLGFLAPSLQWTSMIQV